MSKGDRLGALATDLQRLYEKTAREPIPADMLASLDKLGGRPKA